MDRLIHSFEEIGFSKNEAKVYMTLLKEPMLNGYEISKNSGVPRSMVYAVIGKLVAQSMISELRTEPPTYAPLPVNKLIEKKIRKTEDTLSFLEQELKAIEKPSETYVIRHIEERKQILNSMKQLMIEANEEIWISIWQEELIELQRVAEKQLDRGLSIYSLLFTDQETTSFGKAFYHHLNTALLEEKRMDQRLTILIRDNKEVLIAGFKNGQIPQAIQTEDPMLVLLAKEYIRHDMMMKVVSKRLGDKELQSLWREDELLSYIVSNRKG